MAGTLSNNFQNGNTEGDLKSRLNVFADPVNAIKMKTEGVCCEDNYNTATYDYTVAALGATLSVVSNDVAAQSGTIAYWTWTVYDNQGNCVAGQTADPSLATVIDTSSLKHKEDWTVQLSAKRTTTAGDVEEICYSHDIDKSLVVAGGTGNTNP